MRRSNRQQTPDITHTDISKHLHKIKITIDKSPMMMYTKNTKRQDLKRSSLDISYLSIAATVGNGAAIELL